MVVHHWSDDGMVIYHRRSLNWIILLQLDIKHIDEVNFYSSDNNSTQKLLVLLVTNIISVMILLPGQEGRWRGPRRVSKPLRWSSQGRCREPCHRTCTYYLSCGKDLPSNMIISPVYWPVIENTQNHGNYQGWYLILHPRILVGNPNVGNSDWMHQP